MADNSKLDLAANRPAFALGQLYQVGHDSRRERDRHSLTSSVHHCPPPFPIYPKNLGRGSTYSIRECTTLIGGREMARLPVREEHQEPAARGKDVSPG